MLKVYIYKCGDKFYQYLGFIEGFIYVLDVETEKKFKVDKPYFLKHYYLHDTINLHIY